MPWGIFLRSRPVWAIICAHFCFNWGYYTLLAWLPSFFQLALHLDVETSSLLTLVPYIAMSVMTPFVGKAADGLVNKGWEMTNVRKLAQVLVLHRRPLYHVVLAAHSMLTISTTAHVLNICPVSQGSERSHT